MGKTNTSFFSTNEERRIKDTLTCKSKNLIYLIECKKCATRNLPCQYIGETKRHLHERFGEHRRSVQNHQQLASPTPVSEHFNLPGHSVNDIRLIPLELTHTNRDSVRKAREAHLIALFTVYFSDLHYNAFERGCEAISGRNCKIARNCLTSMSNYIVMQIRN